MKISLKKSSLAGKTEIISGITPKKTISDSSSVLKLEVASENALILRITNFELTYEATINGINGELGETCVKSSEFCEIIRNFDEDSFNLEKDGNRLLIFSNKSKIAIPIIPKKDFPEVMFENLSNYYEANGEEFIKSLNLCHFALGENPARRNLTGLNIKLLNNNSSIRLVSSDSFRMAIQDLQISNFSGDPVEVIIPKHSLSEIRKIGSVDGGSLRISFNDKLFQVETESEKIKTRLIDAIYPDISKILINEGKYSVKINNKSLVSALKLQKLFLSEVNTASKLTMEAGTMVVEIEKTQFGESIHKIPCDFDGDKLSIGFSNKYLTECLVNLNESEEIEFVINNPSSAVMLKSPKFPNYKNILMPLPISW